MSSPETQASGKRTDRPTPALRQGAVSASWTTALAAALLLAASGCTSLNMPSAKSLDLMSPSSSILFPGSSGSASPYRMQDGTVPGAELAADGSLTMEAYQKIREAKAQHSVVLQVAGDDEPVRVLPLPPGERSVFVSELLTQTGCLKKFGSVQATLYRPSPDSIAGVRMDIKFGEDGTIDPATDYGLRPGDRVQVTQKHTTALQSLVNVALRR